jgi:hypothetical protein
MPLGLILTIAIAAFLILILAFFLYKCIDLFKNNLKKKQIQEVETSVALIENAKNENGYFFNIFCN